MNSFFKNELAKIAFVVEWNPNNDQLRIIEQEISNAIKLDQIIDVIKLQGIISKNCPNALFGLLEGVDNSDLNSLLLLAIKKNVVPPK